LPYTTLFRSFGIQFLEIAASPAPIFAKSPAYACTQVHRPGSSEASSASPAGLRKTADSDKISVRCQFCKERPKRCAIEVAPRPGKRHDWETVGAYAPQVKGAVNGVVGKRYVLFHDDFMGTRRVGPAWRGGQGRPDGNNCPRVRPGYL